MRSNKSIRVDWISNPQSCVGFLIGITCHRSRTGEIVYYLKRPDNFYYSVSSDILLDLVLDPLSHRTPECSGVGHEPRLTRHVMKLSFPHQSRFIIAPFLLLNPIRSSFHSLTSLTFHRDFQLTRLSFRLQPCPNVHSRSPPPLWPFSKAITLRTRWLVPEEEFCR